MKKHFLAVLFMGTVAGLVFRLWAHNQTTQSSIR